MAEKGMSNTTARTVESSQKSVRWGLRVTLAVAGAAVTGLAMVAPVQAEPLWPGGPDIPGVPAIIPAAPPGMAPQPFSVPGSLNPTITPGNGAIVGGKRSIDITYKTPIIDRTAAENSIVISPSANVPGSFEWINDTHVQWNPDEYWPRNTAVTVNVAGTTSAFRVSDDFTSVGDASSHEFVVKIGGDVVKTFPASFGKPGHESPNGSFKVLEKFSEMVMDSSTYGVPITAPEGYKLDVEYATRVTWGGIFVHAAPWSTGSQGNSNVSHGCINLSTENAKWFFDNVRNGDTVNIQGA